MSGTQRWVRIASTADVREGEALGVTLEGLDLALYHVGPDWYCTDNICTHAFARLTEGWLDGHIIECPLHAGQFDVRTGEGCGDPIDIDLKTFPVRVDGSDVLVGLD